MAPAINVGFAPHAFAVPNRHIDDLQIVFGGSENQVEIAERIDLPEVSPVSRDHFLVAAAAQYLGAAKGCP